MFERFIKKTSNDTIYKKGKKKVNSILKSLNV